LVHTCAWRRNAAAFAVKPLAILHVHGPADKLRRGCHNEAVNKRFEPAFDAGRNKPMYAIASKWNYTRDLTHAETQKYIDEQLKSLISGHEGFVRYYDVHVNNRTTLVMHIWESEKHAERAHALIRPKGLKDAGDLVESVEPMHGHVIAEF
jgi:hypothetical protein